MKHILFFFALIISSATYAQDVTDTLVVESGKVYTITTTNYENGNQQIFKQFIGDTSNIQTVYANLISAKAASLAVDVKSVSRYPAILTDLRKNANSILAASGKDAMAAIQADNEAYFLNANATWDLGGTATTFSKTAQGAMRYKVGTATVKSLIIFGDVVRLVNYSASRGVDLYKISANVWINPDRTIVLRRTLPGSRQ